MNPTIYEVLLTEAAGFYEEHGTVDLVHLSRAGEMGVTADAFIRDVTRLVEAIETERQ